MCGFVYVCVFDYYIMKYYYVVYQHNTYTYFMSIV